MNPLSQANLNLPNYTHTHSVFDKENILSAFSTAALPTPKNQSTHRPALEALNLIN